MSWYFQACSLPRGSYEIDVKEFHDIEGLSDAQLLAMTKNVLMALCQQRGLPRTGNKQTLAKQLFQHKTHSQDPGDLLADLFKCWFMAPVRTNSMKIGTLNEENILANYRGKFQHLVEDWVLVHSKDHTFLLLDEIEVGLINCRKNEQFIGSTPDKLAILGLVPVPCAIRTHPKFNQQVPAEAMNSSCFACENKPAYHFAGIPTLKPVCGEHKVDGMT